MKVICNMAGLCRDGTSDMPPLYAAVTGDRDTTYRDDWHCWAMTPMTGHGRTGPASCHMLTAELLADWPEYVEIKEEACQ